MFLGEVHVDWISFGEPYETVNVIDIQKLRSGKIYPNPASDIISLELNSHVGSSCRASLTDITGKVVKQINLGTMKSGINNFSINIADYTPGFYFLQVHFDNNLAFVSKLIKE